MPGNLPQLLRDLEGLWREHGAVNVDRLAQGLEPSEIRTALEERKLSAPQEVVDWFAWHDGPVDDGLGPVATEPGRFGLLSLEGSLTERQERLDGAAYLAGEGKAVSELAIPETWWQPSWLPLSADDPLTVELTDARDGSAPVRVVSWEDPTASQKPRASSLTEVVTLWLRALREHWRFNDEIGRWAVARDELPLELRRTGLL